MAMHFCTQAPSEAKIKKKGSEPPNPNVQAPENFQSSITKRGYGNLELLWRLVLGIWSFNKMIMRQFSRCTGRDIVRHYPYFHGRFAMDDGHKICKPQPIRPKEMKQPK
jgi:hypothetical protein